MYKKIVGLTPSSPYCLKTWSGSSYYFFKALQKRNVLLDVVSTKPSEVVLNLARLRSFSFSTKKWRFQYECSLFKYYLMRKKALNELAKIEDDYEYILQIGASCDISPYRNKKIISYHDGNFAALINSPYAYPNISIKTVKSILKYEYEVYRKIDKIFCFSKWLAESFHKYFDVPYSKLNVLGAGINIPVVEPVIKNKDYSKPNILFIGLSFERKGGKNVIEAFELVKKNIPKLQLKIITLPKFHKYPVPDGISYLDIIDKTSNKGYEKIQSLYSWASVFIMPSLYEPFGIVFLEAMAHRLPCIGTNVCAVPEIIDDGVTGFLVPVDDSSTLAMKIIEILTDPLMADQMGSNGYRKFLNNFGWDNVCQSLICCLD